MLNLPSERHLTALLCKLATMNNTKEDENVVKVELWVQKQVALGTLRESQIRTILKIVTESGRSTNTKAKTSILWSICPRIWQGIKFSTVRTIWDLQESTITRLIEAAVTSPDFDEGFAMAAEVILGRAKNDSNPVNSHVHKFLRLFVSNYGSISRVEFYGASFLENVKQTIRLLELLPKATSTNEVTVSIFMSLFREESGSKGGILRTERRVRLQEWLSALSQSHILVDARRDERWWPAWRTFEARLSLQGPELIASYLRSFSDTEISSFLLQNLLIRWQLYHTKNEALLVPSSSIRQLREKALRILTPPSALQNHEGAGAVPALTSRRTEVCPYRNLITHISVNAPHLLKPLVQILLPLLRHLKKPVPILFIIHFLRRKNNHIPLNLLFSETSHHTDTNPVFALDLLTTDRRPRTAKCPSIQRALSKCDDVPINILFRLFYLLINRYASRARPGHKSPLLTPEAITLLYQVTDRIIKSESQAPSQILRRVRRVLSLFYTRPDLLDARMSRTLAMAGIVRSLQARQKVPDWRKQWVGRFVVGLEGGSVFEEVERISGSWWEEIEERERREGKVWEAGRGWVQVGQNENGR